MVHHTCCNKQKVRRGLWSPEEDEKLFKYISTNGHGCWSSLPKLAGLQRCGKSCRLRWINYLRPDLKRGSFSPQEESIIIELHRMIGNRWSQIAKRLPGRTDNEVKNFWNCTIKKKLIISHAIGNGHGLVTPLPHSQLISNSSSPPEELMLPIMNMYSNQMVFDHLCPPINVPIPMPPGYYSHDMHAPNMDVLQAPYIFPSLDANYQPILSSAARQGLTVQREFMATYNQTDDARTNTLPTSPIMLHEKDPSSRLSYFTLNPDQGSPNTMVYLDEFKDLASPTGVNLAVNPTLQAKWLPDVDSTY